MRQLKRRPANPFSMAMAWGLFEKRDTESMSRIVSARTLDGAKIRVKLQLQFIRPIAQSEAEAMITKYARSYQRAIESELSDGMLPFDELELQRRLTDEIRDLPRPNVRILGLHLLANGEPSSQSPAIRAGGMLPTLPSMYATGDGHDGTGRTASVGEKSPGSDPKRIETQRTPSRGTPSWQEAVSSAPTIAQSLSESPDSATTRANMPQSTGSRTASPSSAEHPTDALSPTERSVRLPRTRVSLPAWRPPGHLADWTPATQRLHTPAPRSHSQPSFEAVANSKSTGEPADTAVPPLNSGFQRALESEPLLKLEALADRWIEPLRRTSVALALYAMQAGHENAQDPMSWFEGGSGCRALVEACAACISSLLYEALLRASVPHGSAVTIVQQACRGATLTEASAAQIGQFLGGNRIELLRGAAAKALNLDSRAELSTAFEAPLRVIAKDLRSCVRAMTHPHAPAPSLSPTG